MEKEKLEFIDRVRYHAILRNVVLSREVLDFIACQFALESNFGTSSLAVSLCNYCGMKVPFRRLFYGIVTSDSEFAFYWTFDDCVLDYISWIMFNRPTNMELKNLDDFKRFLRNSGYCLEKDYIDKINSIYSLLKS